MSGKKRRARRLNVTNRRIFLLLILQTVLVVLAAIAGYIITEFFSRYFGISDVDLSLFAILVPTAALVGVITYFMSKVVYRYVSVLADGIGKVAEGDFSVRLDVSRGGPLTLAYENFNKMCAELSNVEILKNDFLNDYAHELKTPITSINGFAKLLLEEDVTEEERRVYLQLIADESLRLAALSDSTLLMSRLDSQAIVKDKKEYNLGEQLRRCVILLSVDWGKKDISVDGSEIKDVFYSGNEALMQEVWCNLLSNAVKYTPKGGEIRVSVSENADSAVVTVSDTGEGIPAEALPRIFEKYYRADKSHAQKGVGLGLAIVDKIVRLCNGKIEVESAVHEGTAFTVTLPK